MSILSDMKVKTPHPFPSVDRQLKAFGQRLREARLRRGISSVLFCERMNISRDTLNRLEKGDASIAIGSYLRALRLLGMDKDFDAVAKNDELGRKLQDAKLLVRTPRGRGAKNELPETDTPDDES
jgi:transcriptional regulator with XRE-family HTH domain